MVQLGGSIGATSNQPERKELDALAIVLVLLGPAALAFRDRLPVVAVAVTMGAACLYIGLGYAPGPIFLSVVVALVHAVLAGHRRADVDRQRGGVRRLRRGHGARPAAG